MIFSKFFKNSESSSEKDSERNLLFAPNYLIKTKNSKDHTEYTFGGDSIIIVEQNEKINTGLFFKKTRNTKANKLSLTEDGSLHLGLQNLEYKNYLILGTRKMLANAKSGDQLTLKFNDGSSVVFPLETCSNTKKKAYACNLRASITDEQLVIFTKKLLDTYQIRLSETKEVVENSIEKDAKRKFREAAQSYMFVLKNYY